MHRNNSDDKSSTLKYIYQDAPMGSILRPFLFNIYMNGIFVFLTMCDMCHKKDDDAPCIYSRDFHHVQEYLKKGLEILENWLFSNDAVLNPRKCEFMGFRKTNKIKVLSLFKSGWKTLRSLLE